MALVRDTIRDAELVTACLNGDPVAWEHLIRSYQRLIYSVARVLCPDRRDADEVFQQVCLELYRRLADIRDAARLPKWLVTVTRRQCITLFRSRGDTSAHDQLLDENSLPQNPHVQTVEHRHAIKH